MPGKLSSTLLLLTALLCPLARAGEDVFIQRLQIRGSGRRVELETHAGQTLDRGRIARDVRRLWATGWFEDIRVESGDTPQGIELVFTLVEKPRLYLRRVEFEPKSQRRPVRIEPGTPIDAVLAHRVAAALRRQLVEQGYAEARVRAQLIPAGFQEADLRLRVETGRRYRVREVKFSGTLGMKPKELQRALRSTRIRRVLPGVPGLWGGWRVHPPFSKHRADADVDRLRSLYLSRGYFDARLGLAGVDFTGNEATITIAVESGARYQVRRTEMLGAGPPEGLEPRLTGNFPVQELCRCLLRARRRSEREGRVDFSSRLQVEATPAPPWARLAHNSWRSQEEDSGEPGSAPDNTKWVAVTARTVTGPAYAVERIEFRGHHSFSDSTLRRALLLQEGDPLDWGRLRRSLVRLNRLGFLEPLTEENVRVLGDPERARANLVIVLKEKPRGRWSLSGPLGPLSVAGPLQFRVKSRLPSWGRGVLQLSTYYATFSLLSFSQPFLRALSGQPLTRLQALVALERPYLPGQRWRSGFIVSPNLGWRGVVASYGLTQARTAARRALAGDPAAAARLAVPVWWVSREDNDGPPQEKFAGYLQCEDSQPHWKWLRATGTTALNLLLTESLF